MKYFFAALMAYLLACPMTDRVELNLANTDWTNLATYFWIVLGWVVWVVIVGVLLTVVALCFPNSIKISRK